MARVLVVSNESSVSAPIAEKLESSGHDVMCCPGPQPSRACPAGRGCRCALAAGADVVVLDGWLATDAWRTGTSSWRLIGYYRSQHLPVVALVGPNGLPGPNHDEGLLTLPRSADPDDVDASVHSALETEAR